MLTPNEVVIACLSKPMLAEALEELDRSLFLLEFQAIDKWLRENIGLEEEMIYDVTAILKSTGDMVDFQISGESIRECYLKAIARGQEIFGELRGEISVNLKCRRQPIGILEEG